MMQITLTRWLATNQEYTKGVRGLMEQCGYHQEQEGF